MPEKTARGGINACEPPFLRALENSGNIIREEIYSFDNPKGISNAKRISNVIKTARKWRNILAQEKFDLIHLNSAFDKNAVLRDFFILSVLKNKEIKVFLKFHGSDVNLIQTKSAKLVYLWEKVVEKADAVGVLSSEEKEHFVQAGVSADKIFVVKNAVNIQSKPEIQRFEGKTLKLLFVSRLIKTKGLFETIRVCEILGKKNISFKLDVLGDGEIRQEAEILSQKLNLQDSINFHGHVSETAVNEFYRKSDLLVFPTFHQEGFPMVVFNALANGLPIITTKIRAAADYLKESENCLFCESQNPEDLAEKIERLYQDPDLMRKMSDNNITLAKEFSAEKIAPEYLEIYRQIVNS